MATIEQRSEEQLLFSHRLREARKAAGLSRAALAGRLRCAVTNEEIAAFEHGKAIPEPQVVTELAAALGRERIWLQPGRRPSATELVQMGPEERQRAFAAWPPEIDEDELAAWDATDAAELSKEQ